MSATFDTLAFARRLHKSGMDAKQALGIAEATKEMVMGELVTKSDLEKLELRMTIKLGSVIMAGIGLLAVILKLPV